MTRLKVVGAQQRRHELAALADAPVHQTLPATNPTTSPARLREIAVTRRREAAHHAKQLQRRGNSDDAAARWTRLDIERLLEAANNLERDADAAERGL